MPPETYTLIREPGKPDAIRCGLCGATSYHPADVENHYCGRCHKFLDDVAEEERLRSTGTIIVLGMEKMEAT